MTVRAPDLEVLMDQLDGQAWWSATIAVLAVASNVCQQRAQLLVLGSHGARRRCSSVSRASSSRSRNASSARSSRSATALISSRDP